MVGGRFLIPSRGLLPVTLVLLVGALTSCGDSRGTASGEPVELSSCSEVAAFAREMSDVGITFDYQPSESPSALAAHVGLVVQVELTTIDALYDVGENETSFLVSGATVAEVLAGEGLVAEEIFEFVVQFNPAIRDFKSFESAFRSGIPAVLFLDRQPSLPGGWQTWTEGFWVACDRQSTALAVGLDAVFWDGTFSLDELGAASRQ